jgi:hypothetical protein
MYEILKALSIRMDAPAQSFTKDAIAQVLVKIIYNSNSSVTKNQIFDEYKKLVNCDEAKKGMIVDILNLLIQKNEIKYNKGQVYLSTSKRAAIDKIKEESASRFKYVVDTYFKPYFSDDVTVYSWLQDALITFFSLYSKEWIADLCYGQSTVSHDLDQIIELISRRTKNNKDLNRDDYDSLINSFGRIFTEKDNELSSLLWEYGTSQFSAQLIKSGDKIDKLTVETFSNAICLVDTNILIHLSLPGTEYSKNLTSIEKAFGNLGIKVKYLHITKDEYEHTIGSRQDEVLKLLDSFDTEVVENADNQFVFAAKNLGCKSKDDYIRFFNQIMSVPTVVDKTLMLSLLDDSYELETVIKEAQSNESKILKLNTIYQSFNHRDKKTNALIHDVGLIAGADFLRKENKLFILTQDSSIINYAKQYPFQQGLPIAIKTETLLNVLAVNSYKSSEEDYISLFASLIRKGMQPQSTTFRLTDLSYILEKEQFISQLPHSSVISIVTDVSRKRLLGESDEEINKELTRKVQNEKFKVVKDLDKARSELSNTKEQKELAEKKSAKANKVLVTTWTKEKSKQIDREIRKVWTLGILSIIGIIIITAVILYLKKEFINSSVNNKNPLFDIGTAILLDIAGSWWTIVKKIIPKISRIKKTRSQVIEDYINEKMKATYE